MGFGKLKVKCRMRGARGTMDANSIFKAVIDSWKDLAEACGNLAPEEQQAVRDHFNNLIEDNDDLGDILFGDDADEFEQRVIQLDGQLQTRYADELVSAEIIDIQHMD